MKICYYISDHGLGHASRASVVANTLVKQGHSVTVVNHTARQFLRANLKTHQLVNRKTDVGPVMLNNTKSTFGVNWKETEVIVSKYLENADKYIDIEKKFLKTFDLVVSDVVPHSIIAADELGIPSVLVSNFSWLSLYYRKLPNPICQWFSKAYAKCTMQLELPFAISHSGVKKIKKVGLVTRRATNSKEILRQKFGITSDKKVIYVGFGGWDSKSIHLDLPDKYRYLIAGRDFNQTTLNSQDYIAASDLIITKAGYSTVSEAISANVPLICASIPNSKESDITAKTVSKNNFGISIKIKDFHDISKLENTIREAFEIKPRPTLRFKEIGEEQVLMEIEKLK